MSTVARKSVREVFILALITFCIAGEPAHADLASPTVGLEEIVVTARKREERLQETPISIAAFKPEDLKARSIENVRDLAAAVPNLSVVATQAGSSANAQLYMRGVGQYDYKVTSDQAVGLYVDGVYMARSMGASLDVVDVERLEVLRGPQGTLFGRNNVAGAIQVVSIKPSEESSAYLEATTGSRNRIDLRAMVNVPLIDDRLLARLTVSRLRQDGYGYRLFQNVDTGNTHNDSVRLQLALQASDSLHFLLSVDGARRRGNSSVETLTEIQAPEQLAAYNADLIAQGLRPITAANFVTGNPYTSWANSDNRDDYDSAGASLVADWAASDALSLKSITAYRLLGSDSDFDFGNVPYPFSTQKIHIRQHQFSQELQASFTGLNQRLKTVAGLYFFQETGNELDLDPYFEQPIATGECDLCFTVADPFRNGYTIVDNQQTDSAAAYLQSTYSLNDRVNLTAGVRYTHDRKSLLDSLQFVDSYLDYVFERPLGRTRNSWSDLSPHVAIEYKPRPDLMWYASVTKGYRSGGFNGISFDAVAPESYGPEKIIDFEAGIKSEWLQRRLRFNLNGFLYEYSDFVGTALQNAAFVVSNIGKLHLYGAELESTALLTDSLQVTVNGAYLGQRTKEVVPGGESTLSPTSRLPNAPQWTWDTGLRYTFTPSIGRFELNAQLSYRARAEFLLPNYPGEAQGGYTVVNSAITFKPAAANWSGLELSLFGRNLTDKAYKIYGENDVGYGSAMVHAQFARPREWGLSARYRFGAAQ